MKALQLLVTILCSTCALACGAELEPEQSSERDLELVEHGWMLPNNLPIPNQGGLAATYSTQGSVELNSEFFTPQGSNGRHCGSCHAPQAGWSVRPSDVQRLFDLSGGLHPIFNLLDANTPVSDVSTVEARRQSYSMLLKGKFVRLRTPPANAEFEVTQARDPFGYGTTARLLFFRRPLPTANFKSHTVMWDGANTVGTDLRAGLVRQARGNVTGAQQGAPASDEVIAAIVDYELALSHAQLIVSGAGRLDAGSASGGPEAHAAQPLTAARFDLFDAWRQDLDPERRQIARGQELFNSANAGNGQSCSSCHNAANNGQNVNGVLFDIGASKAEYAEPDMAVYTLRHKLTGEVKETTDPGLGFVTGRWRDVNRFKTPNLRGLSARAPYFHNGIAHTLLDVVHFYERELGFVYTPEQEADLVAFMNAL